MAILNPAKVVMVVASSVEDYYDYMTGPFRIEPGPNGEIEIPAEQVPESLDELLGPSIL